MSLLPQIIEWDRNLSTDYTQHFWEFTGYSFITFCIRKIGWEVTARGYIKFLKKFFSFGGMRSIKDLVDHNIFSLQTFCSACLLPDAAEPQNVLRLEAQKTYP